MGAKVYANGREVLGKAGSGKVIAAFPDVCLSPPSPPAGPVPIPYPVSSKDEDTVDGSKSVKAGGKEVVLSDKSSLKKCTGDEPATKSLGQGTVSHTLKGKVHAIAFSMDVIVEGEGVVRHLDPTTSNQDNAAVPMVTTKSAAVGATAVAPSPEECAQALKKYPIRSHKDQSKVRLKMNAAAKEAGQAVQYDSHHVLQNAHFAYDRTKPVQAICPRYSEDAAPAIVLRGPSTDLNTPHGVITAMQNDVAKEHKAALGTRNPTYGDARDDAHKQLTAPPPGPGMTPPEAECVLIEVDRQFAKMCGKRLSRDSQLRAPNQSGPGFKRKRPNPPRKTKSVDVTPL